MWLLHVRTYVPAKGPNQKLHSINIEVVREDFKNRHVAYLTDAKYTRQKLTVAA